MTYPEHSPEHRINKLKSLSKSLSKTQITPFNSLTLYHGTTLKRAKKIIKYGYDFTKSGEKSKAGLNGMSTTINFDLAKEHSDWASEEFEDKSAVITARISNLNLMLGKDFFSELDNNDINKVLSKASKKYDGVIMYDYENGEGIEEEEILIFNDKNIKWKLV